MVINAGAEPGRHAGFRQHHELVDDPSTFDRRRVASVIYSFLYFGLFVTIRYFGFISGFGKKAQVGMKL